jgi:hypothetical protein
MTTLAALTSHTAPGNEQRHSKHTDANFMKTPCHDQQRANQPVNYIPKEEYTDQANQTLKGGHAKNLLKN